MNALRKLAFISLVASFGFAYGCSSDGDKPDTGIHPDAAGMDAGTPEVGGQDVPPNPDAEVDAGMGDSGMNRDAGDGGASFAQFIVDLIQNHTNRTEAPVDLPSPDLQDNENPDEYEVLFP